MAIQFKFPSPNDYYPNEHALQSSVADIAPTLVDVLPEGQFIPKQAVNDPPVEYVPAKQLVQPCASLVAPDTVAIVPALHCIGIHTVPAPPTD